MSLLRLSLHEGARVAEDLSGTTPPPAPGRRYVVVRPLFKRGRTWQPGEVIDLDTTTAEGFLAAGDIEEHP